MSAVEYDGKFHMVDTSMSNLVTEDDGVTLATVEEAAAESARLVRERRPVHDQPERVPHRQRHDAQPPDIVNPSDGSVTAGFAADFCAAGLKYRDYYYNWNSGHRYVLNLRERRDVYPVLRPARIELGLLGRQRERVRTRIRHRRSRTTPRIGSACAATALDVHAQADGGVTGRARRTGIRNIDGR